MNPAKLEKMIEVVREAGAASCDCHYLEFANEECRFCMMRCRARKMLCDALLGAPEVLASYKALAAFGATTDRVNRLDTPELPDDVARALSTAADEVVRVAAEIESKTFEAWKALRVLEDVGILAGEPCFRGLRLPVRKIGEMLRAHGAAAEKEIALDYPDLSKEDLAFALKYVIVHPRPRTEALDP